MHDSFYSGFLKVAAEQDVDEHFVLGFFKAAEKLAQQAPISPMGPFLPTNRMVNFTGSPKISLPGFSNGPTNSVTMPRPVTNLHIAAQPSGSVSSASNSTGINLSDSRGLAGGKSSVAPSSPAIAKPKADPSLPLEQQPSEIQAEARQYMTPPPIPSRNTPVDPGYVRIPNDPNLPAPTPKLTGPNSGLENDPASENITDVLMAKLKRNYERGVRMVDNGLSFYYPVKSHEEIIRSKPQLVRETRPGYYGLNPQPISAGIRAPEGMPGWQIRNLPVPSVAQVAEPVPSVAQVAKPVPSVAQVAKPVPSIGQLQDNYWKSVQKRIDSGEQVPEQLRENLQAAQGQTDPRFAKERAQNEAYLAQRQSDRAYEANAARKDLEAQQGAAAERNRIQGLQKELEQPFKEPGSTMYIPQAYKEDVSRPSIVVPPSEEQLKQFYDRQQQERAGKEQQLANHQKLIEDSIKWFSNRR